jgi:hypothetical protein
VTAARNLGIQVWMLGEGRAIPRNYYHTVINDAAVDWLTAGQNYNDVIIKASGEAPKHHTFVTEYAGSSGVMKGQLDFPGRFGDQTELGSQPDAVAFTSYMTQHGYPFNGQVTTILGDYIPFPSGIAATGISAAQYYQNLGYYLGQYKAQHPSVFERYTFRYDGPAMADELTQRVATPTRAASALFDAHPYLTRLYTTLSPEDMSEDPVFSYNPGLPDISNVHEATLTYECSYLGSSNQNDTFAWLRTADGFTIGYPNGTAGASSPLATLPASRQIQILREAGDPEVVTDNTGAISGALGQGGGCSVALGDATRRSAPVGLAVMVLLGLAVARRRSRGR